MGILPGSLIKPMFQETILDKFSFVGTSLLHQHYDVNL